MSFFFESIDDCHHSGHGPAQSLSNFTKGLAPTSHVKGNLPLFYCCLGSLASHGFDRWNLDKSGFTDVSRIQCHRNKILNQQVTLIALTKFKISNPFSWCPFHFLSLYLLYRWFLITFYSICISLPTSISLFLHTSTVNLLPFVANFFTEHKQNPPFYFSTPTIISFQLSMLSFSS